MNVKGTTGNMGAVTNDPTATTDVCWWAEWYEFWKKPIKVRWNIYYLKYCIEV